MRFRGVIDTLDQLIKNAIEIDDKLFERSIEKRYNGGTSGEGRSTFFAKSRNYHSRHKERDPYRPMLIELNFTKRNTREPLKGKKQHGGKKAITCYSCGKPGYIARDYRSKNIVYRPQINILEKVPIENDGHPEEEKPPTLEDIQDTLEG